MPDTVTLEGLREERTAEIRSMLTEEFEKRQAAGEESAEATAARDKGIEERLDKIDERFVANERTAAEHQMVKPEILERVNLKKWPPDPEWLTMPTRSEEEAEIQKVCDDLVIIRAFGDWDPRSPLGAEERRAEVRGASLKYLKRTRLRGTEVVERALDSYTATGALEWVPTIMSSQFIQTIDNKLVVAPLFQKFTMTAKVVEYPGDSGDADAYLMTGSENAAVTEDASVLSRKVTFTSQDLATRRDYSDNLEQDSIVSILPIIQGKLARTIARSIDRAILGGDNGVTHMDLDVTVGTDVRKSWDGLRRKALTDTGANADLGTFNLDNLLTIPANMGAYSEDPNMMAWIFSSNTHWSQLFTLKDSAGNPLWLPANTPGAPNPVVTGQIGWLCGIPVVVSGLLRTTLSQNGYYQGGSYESNNTWVALVRLDAWALGDRKQITVESDKVITTGTNRVVTRWRGDFEHLHGTALSTAMGYNVAVA